ncbi:hypothetical protein ACH5RR_022975, partial [Cinchona calisaya]
GVAFRGHDETLISDNRGNFLTLLELLGDYNEQVASVILENAPKNAAYSSHRIQKELLSIIAERVHNRIREDIDPIDGYKLFNVENICKLANTYYPMDFTEQEKLHLKIQLELFKLHVKNDTVVQDVSTISELCRELSRIGNATHYPLVDRVIRLVITLPISSASTKRAFSAMKIIKNRMQNKMGDDILSNSLIVYIERDIVRSLDINLIIDDFDSIKDRRAQFKMPNID